MTKNDSAHIPGAQLDDLRTKGDDLHPILRFAGKNWKPIAAGLGAVIIVIAGTAVYESMKKSSMAKTQDEVAKAVAIEQDADRMAALEKILASGPGGAKPGVLLAVAKTATDSKDFVKAAAAWGDLAAESDKDLRALALLGQAAALSQTGDNAKALEILDKLQSDAPKAFEMLVIRQLAVTAEAAGDNQKAIAGYERLLSEGNLPNKGFLETKIEQLKSGAKPAEKANS